MILVQEKETLALLRRKLLPEPQARKRKKLPLKPKLLCEKHKPLSMKPRLPCSKL